MLLSEVIAQAEEDKNITAAELNGQTYKLGTLSRGFSLVQLFSSRWNPVRETEYFDFTEALRRMQQGKTVKFKRRNITYTIVNGKIEARDWDSYIKPQGNCIDLESMMLKEWYVVD